MAKIDPKDLLEAGVHFGHRTDKWNPRMKPFIYEARNGIHIINLSKTADQIEAAGKFLREAAAKGGKILFVGCKKASQEAVKEVAARSHAFYVCERWLGGTLTNLNTIRKSVARMREIDAMEGGKFKEMPKQEVAALRREVAKLHKNLDGIKDLERHPDVMVIVDITREEIALKEAQRLKIPVVAITDTNADPELVQYPIPANDDAIRSIRIVLQALGDSIVEGANQGAKKRGAKEEVRAASDALEGVSA
jgi:small subunit ribosomal protein S2